MVIFDKIKEHLKIQSTKNQIKYDIKKSLVNGIFIVFLSVLLLILWASIELNKPIFFLLSEISFAIIVIFSLLFAFLIFKIRFRKPFKNNYHELAYKLIILMIFMWILIQITFIISIELNYFQIKNEYTEKFDSYNSKNNDIVESAWFVTSQYNNEYANTYGTTIASPIRSVTYVKYVEINPIFNPILEVYYGFFNGKSKLTVVQQQGHCGEFADAQSFFINEITGLKTRKITFVGVDHQFPEISIFDNWYVFDKTYTTQNMPINAKDYATHLKNNFPTIYHNLTNLLSSENSPNLLEEHGFKICNKDE